MMSVTKQLSVLKSMSSVRPCKLMQKNARGIRTFDVTLRDSIQPVKQIYSLDHKKNLLHHIIDNHFPNSIEIGSIVNPKIVPQMANSLELFKYVRTTNIQSYTDIYMLTPTPKSVAIGKENNLKCFSFISSVSEQFQQKNTRRGLSEIKHDIDQMYNMLSPTDKVKIYISCVNECPIQGKISNSHIINEVLYYSKYFNSIQTEICLSDTCATLQFEDYKEILDGLVYANGMCRTNLSTHFHVPTSNKNGMLGLMSMIKYSLDMNINKFDVSCISTSGGCFITMDDSKLAPNLNYNIINRFVNPMSAPIGLHE